MDDNKENKNTAIAKLNSLNIDHTIDYKTYEFYLSKVKKLSDHLIRYLETEKILSENLMKLKEENNKSLHEQATLSRRAQELQEDITKTTEELRKGRIELSEFETTRIPNRDYDIGQKKENIQELKEKIKESENEQIKNLKKQISDLKEKLDLKIESMKKIESDIKNYEVECKKIQTLKESIDASNDMKLKRKNETIDYTERLKNDIENEKRNKDHNEFALENLRKEISNLNTKKQLAEDEIKKIIKENGDLKDCIDNEKMISKNCMEDYKILKDQEQKYGNKLDELKKTAVALETQRFHSKEDYRRVVKDHKDEKEKAEKARKRNDECIRKKKDIESNLIKMKTSLEEEKGNHRLSTIKHKGLIDEINNTMREMDKLERDVENKEKDKELKNSMKKEEEKSLGYVKLEQKQMEDIKKSLLTRQEKIKENIEDTKNLRETIARTVSRLLENTRQISEEIQIKELIFLDMTKKNEELKTMYNKYHILYETVLAERNKNVVKIQSANQRRAEYKEKMKIITTEMDILQSELEEINNKVKEKEKDLNKIVQKQNTIKQDINNLQFDCKKFEEEIKKLTNENEKLHSILNSIESDMVNLRIEYEQACESRNFTGIQLIDRNDELCIFYEKIQHLDSDIKNLYKNILEKEAKFQKLTVDNAEIERYIEVNRRKIPQIPEFSNKIKELDNELKILNKKLEDLVNLIENPNNEMKHELPGEDPEIDFLKMKYERLEDMLNRKKEELLEKELINEEINDIAEKLRKQALDDRAKNIDISEKMNEFELKLNDITRKIIASASELSMFKAMLLKLEKEKEFKEDTLDKAKERFKNNEPPTDDCMEILEKRNRLEYQRGEYIQKRKKDVFDKENLPIDIPLRNAPEERFKEYEDGKTGLRKAYGKYAPFAVKPTPPNLRFFKNPKPKNPEGKEKNDLAI